MPEVDIERIALRLQATFRGIKSRRETGFFSGYDQFDRESEFERPTLRRSVATAELSTREEEEDVYRNVELELDNDADAAPVVIQVGGHGMLMKAKGSMDRLVKEVPYCEVAAYASVQGTPLEGLFATYYGHESKGALYSVTLHDMTSGMARPCVMDIKMGKRTFLESEVKTTKKRPDLAAKMIKLDPAALTEVEVVEGVTKLRYMQFREVFLCVCAYVRAFSPTLFALLACDSLVPVKSVRYTCVAPMRAPRPISCLSPHPLGPTIVL